MTFVHVVENVQRGQFFFGGAHRASCSIGSDLRKCMVEKVCGESGKGTHHRLIPERE